MRSALLQSSPAIRKNANISRNALAVEALEDRIVMSADAAPVLLVLPNQDFWYADYADTRQALEESGIDVRVAAATKELAKPHYGSGQGRDGGFVQPDLALADVEAGDYSAIAFLGGWGAASYQYGFEGDYWKDSYDGVQATKTVVNDLINEFVAQDKYVAGICFGVSVLAWARVDGDSLLEGKTVAAWHGAGPGSSTGESSNAEWHYTVNGANLLDSGSIGDAGTSADDVYVDGKIITAENWQAGHAFGATLAQKVIADAAENAEEEQNQVQPVLMVIANQDFYYQEYGDTRASLEAAGLTVVVAAGELSLCTPHWNSGQGEDGGFVMPDLAIADVDASQYSAVVFVGGWGSSSYQYGYEGTYYNDTYNGDADVKSALNDMINEFVDQDKYVAAICHGVSVLAYARVDGESLLEGKTVSAWAGMAPGSQTGDATTRWHIEGNGATMVASGSIGDPGTVEDDVIVDGNIITAENYDSARYFGEVIARQLQS